MNDRELLEMAAKAAGYKVRWHDRWQCHCHVSPNNTGNPPTLAGQRQTWSPLTDDGDALRLAVVMRFAVHVENYCTRVFPQWEETALALIQFSECKGDVEASTRLAITSAAAEIGKNMP